MLPIEINNAWCEANDEGVDEDEDVDEGVDDELESSFFEPKLVFSHDDVVNDRVTYELSPNATHPDLDDEDGGPQNDVFNFTLIAPRTQPAVGSLQLEVDLPPATDPPQPADLDDPDVCVRIIS